MSFSCKSILLDVDSIEDFKNNMKLVLQVFEKLPKGAPGLFCQILDLIGGVSQIDQNRMMVILAIILEDCLTDQFKTVFTNEKNARRNLNKFLTKTGSIFCFQEAIKILQNVSRRKEYENSVAIFGKYSGNIDDSYHSFIANASRDILKVSNDKKIEFFNVTRKMFRDEEEAVEVSVYDFLYMDKVNDEFHHFVLLEDGAVLDKIQLKDVHMLDGSILSTPSWLFYLESKDDIKEILGIVQKKKVTTRAENVRDDFFGDQAKDDYIEENVKDKIMEKDVKLTLNDE